MKKNRVRDKIGRVLFEDDTRMGRLFNIILLITILLSVFAVMLNSVYSLSIKYGDIFLYVEWIITILFSIEYFLRIYSAKKTVKYIFSFYGIIDLLTILPTYISLLIAGTNVLAVIRMLRLMRIFRVFKLVKYTKASNVLLISLRNSKTKIVVFLEVVLIIVVIIGSMMYFIEGPENGFISIPKSIYWAIVTITTVGYGDISPQTVSGQTLASILMIVGFAIIAVPTSIVGSELYALKHNSTVCKICKHNSHDIDAKYCKKCGSLL